MNKFVEKDAGNFGVSEENVTKIEISYICPILKKEVKAEVSRYDFGFASSNDIMSGGLWVNVHCQCGKTHDIDICRA